MENIVFVMIVEFDPIIGNKILDVFPRMQISHKQQTFIVQNSMPDFNTNKITDETFYFNIEELHCYVHFSQNKDKRQVRNCKQQSLILVLDVYIKDIEFMLAKLMQYNLDDIYFVCVMYIEKVKDEVKENNLILPVKSVKALKSYHFSEQNTILYKNWHSFHSNPDKIDENTKISLNVVSSTQITNAHNEFQCFKYLKDKLVYILEALMFGKKIKIIAQKPSKLSKFKKYLDKLMHPCVITDYLVYISSFNLYISHETLVCGVTHAKSHILFYEQMSIDLDNTDVIFDKESYKWTKILKQLAVKDKPSPIQYIIDKIDNGRLQESEINKFAIAFSQTEMYKNYKNDIM